MPGAFRPSLSSGKPHFLPHEFERKPRPPKFPTAAPYPDAWGDRLKRLIDCLELIRHELGDRPIKIGSGYRDPAYNKAIGGAKSSQHMAGRAADITVKGVSAAKVHATILKMYNDGRLPMLGGLGQYPTFTHVDVRPTKRLVRWTGSRDEN